MKFLV